MQTRMPRRAVLAAAVAAATAWFLGGANAAAIRHYPKPHPSPSPSPSVTPVPTQSVTPTPIPTGTQYPGVPAFVTTTINVDGTNTTDEAANISNAVAAAASGSSTVWRRFLLQPSGGSTVRISQAVQIATKSYFVLDLNACTLKTDSGAAFTQLTAGIVLGHAFGGFWDGGITNFIVTNGTLWQNNPSPGVYAVAREGQANLEIAGGTTSTPCHDGKVYGMTLRGAGGDNIKLGGTGDIVYNIDGWNNTCLDAGRMGYTVIYGHDLTWGTLGANTHGACGYACIDIEPNVTANPCSAIDVAGNTWTTWVQEFAALNGSSTTSNFDNIKIRNNTISGASLSTRFDNTAVRSTNIYFTGNTSTAGAVAGPVLLFADIDTLRVTGNTQSLSSGALVSTTSCTDAITTPNP